MCNFFCNLTLHLDMQYAYITIVTNFWKYDQCPSTIINLESHHHHFFVINNLIFHTVHGCCENFKNVCSFELKIVLTVVLKNQNSFLYFKNQIMRMDGGREHMVLITTPSYFKNKIHASIFKHKILLILHEKR